jgi:hypothetical protein
MVWHRFSKTKKVINRLHYQLQRERYPNKQRLPAENALTIFDEHGVIALSKNKALLHLIAERRWHELFWQRREQTIMELKLIIFGHGLYEKITNPFLGLCAHSLLLYDDGSGLDDQLAERFFLDKGVSVRNHDLTPIPILGYPSWWPENIHESFYANRNYFRASIAV